MNKAAVPCGRPSCMNTQESSLAAGWKPPTSLWEVSERLKYNQPLNPGDPLWVDTSPGRSLGYERLYRSLGVEARGSDPRDWILRVRHDRHYGVLCGHRGSGKSTELRLIASRLHQPGLFHVVFLDVLADLDINNLQYPDLFLALAHRLFASVQATGVELESTYLTPLVQWFRERVVVSAKLTEIKASLEAGGQAAASVPFLASLFAKLSASFMAQSQEKEEVRVVFKSSFKEFAQAFNTLAAHVQARLRAAGKGKALLFIVDGTDRLDGDDSHAFFLANIHQLQQLDGLFLYCMPIHLAAMGAKALAAFDHVTKVPCLKLREKHDPAHSPLPTPDPKCREVLRTIILRRAPAPLFDPDPVATGNWQTVDRIAELSGGHLRDLVRLLDYAFQHATGDRFDARSVEKAAQSLASDYKRALAPEDFRLLVEIDRAGKDHVPGSEQAHKLLFNLSLLEYNDFWWQSHPVVRLLPAYGATLRQSMDAPQPAP